MFMRSRAGFTLIELILVMAIGSALAMIALLGFSTLRGQAQFSDAVERLNQSVLGQRQEALSTIKSSGGTDTANITFGHILTFQQNSSTVQVQTLVTANNNAPAGSQAVTILAAENTSFTIPWGIYYLNAQTTGPPLGAAINAGYIQVAFVRSPVDGSLQTAMSPGGGWAGRLTGTYRYDNFYPSTPAAKTNLNVTDGSRHAWLTIDPTGNSVTRGFQ